MNTATTTGSNPTPSKPTLNPGLENIPFIANASPIRKQELLYSPDYSMFSFKKASSASYDRKDSYDFNQSANVNFPVLVPDRIQKLNAKFKRRASSPDQNDVIDSTVEETIEENEKDKKVFKRLRILSDEEEFNIKKTHLPKFRGRMEVYGGNLDRCRSLDTDHLPLDRVQEDKNEDGLDYGLEKGRKVLWNMVHDLDEFNIKPKRRGSFGIIPDSKYKKYSLANSKDTIIEEQEKRTAPVLTSSLLFLNQLNASSTNSSLHGSLHGSYHSSPRFKLKVDEIDIKEKEKEKKQEEDYEFEDIEMILEEAEDKNQETQMNKDFQIAKHKLQEEKEFMKKVLKGDVPEVNESLPSNLSLDKEFSYMSSEPIQEVIEEENKGENAESPEQGKV